MTNLSTNDVLTRFGINTLNYYETFTNMWIIARFTYAQGKPVLEDSSYDSFTKVIREMDKLFVEGSMSPEAIQELNFNKIHKILSQVYEMDEPPVEEMRKAKISEAVITRFVNEYNNKLNYKLKLISDEQLKEFEGRIITVDGVQYPYNELGHLIDDMVSEDPPKSITPVEHVKEAYGWFQDMKGKELCVSLKIDGINIRAFYINGHFVYACTRGRAGDVKDYTLVLSKKLPWYLKDENGNPVTGIVRGECYVDKDALEYLRTTYSADYVVPRTAATTMLCTPHMEQDYKYLKLTAFNALSGGLLSDRINLLNASNFDTVPYILTKWEGGTYEEFYVWVMSLIEDMWKFGEMSGIKTDGIVVEVNDSNEYEKLISDGMYNNGNIALKIGRWQPGLYQGVLEEILVERKPASYQYSVRGRIKPVKVDSGITIQHVNLFNLGLVSEYGLKEGDTLNFIFKNDNAVQWVYQFSDEDDSNSEYIQEEQL